MQHPAYWIQAGWIKPVPDWDIDEPVRFTQVLAPGQPVATEVYWEGNGWAAWDDEEYWFVFEENGYWGYWVQYHGTWYIVAELPDSYMGFSNAESLCFFGETTTSRAQLGGSASLPVQVGVLAIATNGGQVGPYTPNFTETPAFPDLHSCNFFSNTSGNLYNWTGRTQDGSGPQSCSGEDDLGVTYTQHANWQATSFCNFYPDQGELGCASGGGWTYTNDNNPNGGARAVYAFDAGTNIGGVNYCYTKANDMGKANVYIDGQFARTVDLSSSKGQSQGWSQWIEWGRCDFFYTPPGIHIIEVEETGIPGALTLFGQLPYINVDVFLAQ